jgi:hydroxyacylglutathione hydrolase
VNLFFHFSVDGFSNTYLLGPDAGGDAILIDPGTMNVALLNLIESNGYYIRNVLVTHGHESHVAGLKTLRKIYDFDIYAEADTVLDFSCIRIGGGQTLKLGEFTIKVYALHGHSSDSLAFAVESCLFTGDVMNAGALGSTPNGYARELLIGEITSKLLRGSENYYVFPGHGAPSTLEAERLINPAFAGSRKSVSSPSSDQGAEP